MALHSYKTTIREWHNHMSQDNFSITRPQLGTDSSYGADRDYIDKQFNSIQQGTAPTCIVCTNTAGYKLIPKHSHNNTAEIQDRGYVCEHCLKQQYFKPEEYGIRQIPTTNNIGGSLL